jgi:hypothetical protein
MSIFGQLDAESVSSNPFKVERGVYSAEVTKFEFRTTANGQRMLILNCTISDAESQFDGERVDKTYFLPPEDMTQEMLDSLPADEKKRIMRNLSTLKKDLCGDETRSDRKGLGIDPNDLNDPNWNPAVVVGTPVTIGVNNYGTNGSKVDIGFINLREE